MLKPRHIAAGLLFVAGCATSPEEKPPQTWDARPPSEIPVEVEHVEESPRIAAPAVASPDKVPPVSNALCDVWISLPTWASQQGFAFVPTAVQPPGYILRTTNGVIELQSYSQVMRWEGAELRLGFPLRLTNGEPFINERDLRKNVEPLVAGTLLPPAGQRTVVIDAGHGGMSSGTRSVLEPATEKVFTLDWALRLEALLATNGWNVFLTRTNDVDIPLPARVAFANEVKADLFISLHFNSAAPSREQNGLETFCLTPQGMPSTLTREYEDNAALSFTNNMFDSENLSYAMAIHRSILKIAGPTDRGVRRARFLGVLRGQNRPAVLVEGGYLSNPREAEQIADPAYRQKLAEAVAAAIAPPASTTAAPSQLTSMPETSKAGIARP